MPWAKNNAVSRSEAIRRLVELGLKKGWAPKLKMWNADRGFGFIADDSGGPDIFLHISALQSAGIDADNISKGDRLTFDVESTRDGKNKASNVRQG